jgi:serralysin
MVRAYTDDPRDHVGRQVDLTTVDGLVAPDPQGFNLDDFVGFTFRGKTIFDLDGVIQQIDSGSHDKVNSGKITYSFLNMDHLTGLFNNPTLGFTAGDGVNPFNEAQKAEARESIQFWDDLIAPQFEEKNGVGADIRFANSADPAQAYAYYPTPGHGYKFASDVFIADPELNWTNNWLGFNGYGATTLIHELGHSIGLSHPGAYNFTPGIPQTYLGLAEYAQDSEQYSIMSYWAPSETNALIVDWNTFLIGNAQTPMLHDILTAQSIYGADLTTRTGDTVYGFNSNAGRDVFNFANNSAPNVSIYDAGGNDTIDLSGFNAGVFIDLHDGQFSSGAQALPTAAVINANRAALTELTDGAQTFAPVTQASVNATGASYMNAAAARIAGDTGYTGVFATAYDNLSIAYGTVIENAIGGSQRDVLWGNAVANRLEGRGGNDVLNGFEGADTLVGGAGSDLFVLSIVESGDKVIDFQTGADDIDLRGTGIDMTWIGGAAFSGVAGQVRFASDVLSVDLNGDGVADMIASVLGDDLVASDVLIL